MRVRARYAGVQWRDGMLLTVAPLHYFVQPKVVRKTDAVQDQVLDVLKAVAAGQVRMPMCRSGQPARDDVLCYKPAAAAAAAAGAGAAAGTLAGAAKLACMPAALCCPAESDMHTPAHFI